MKTALITGAGGSLGKSVTRSMLASGYRVYAIDLKIGGLEDLKIGGLEDSLTMIEADITNTNEIDKVLAGSGLEETGLDVLVSLAGIYDTFPVTEGNHDKFKQIMEVNFLATAHMVSKLFHPLIRKKGRVVVVSSESHKIQAMFQPYMISKAALEAYCHSAWQELALKGVTLSVIRPGAFQSQLLKEMDGKEMQGTDSLFRAEFNSSLQQSKKLVGRVVSPDRVAAVVVKAATASEPKRYYHVNNNPLLSLITLLPKTWIDKLIVKRFKNN